MTISQNAFREADDFIRNEKEFQLGFLPTEQSNPLTCGLEKRFGESCVSGVRLLQMADRKVLEKERSVLVSREWKKLCDEMLSTVRNGGRIVFSGCGATGRLSILLESMWRDACLNTSGMENFAPSVESIMTGGDFALIRSVEFFEDYQSFGRRQARDMKLSNQDMLVAITEGGETSSVLGTVFESLELGAKVFLLFNNPADLLAERLERSRRAIRDERVCVLDLSCGPMSVAGSTRMQATTSEQLCAGSALEKTFRTLAGLPDSDPVSDFACVLDTLEGETNTRAAADWISFEEKTYASSGKITYFANAFLLDVFTDTTERSPTFMLPPFRPFDDLNAAPSWAFVKDPLYPTEQVWGELMHRSPRCLEWTLDDYDALGALDMAKKKMPAIREIDFLKIQTGNEDAVERRTHPSDAALLIRMKNDSALERAYKRCSENYPVQKIVSFAGGEADYSFALPSFARGIGLMEHLALKLVLNDVSTGAMVRLGRVSGNWMSWVDCTNKKLLDRGTRLVSELGKCDYRTACAALFDALLNQSASGNKNNSPVQDALKYLRENPLK